MRSSTYLYDAQSAESVQRNGKGLLNPLDDRVLQPDSADLMAVKPRTFDFPLK
jgi:hypothetical protein